jgi:catechol 2,3-dioxygenase-like lactoylglutathione lyase family enzyme
MMAGNRISAVLCSTDLERSREFYEGTIGLRLAPHTIPNHLVFECGDGTTLLVYGRGAGPTADHTQVRFWTGDIAADVGELRSRGVVFDEFDLPTIRTVEGIATTAGIGRSAWFKDPDGNTLAVFQPE